MKNRRLVITGLLFAFSLFFFDYFFLVPKADLMKETLETQYSALLKEEAYALGSGATEKGVQDALNEMKTLEERLIPEKTEFSASARLQAVVSGYADKAGVNLMTIRPMGRVKLGGYSGIPVYFEGNGNIKQISELLRSIESGSIMLKVDKLNLSVTSVQNPLDIKLKLQVSGMARL